MSIRELNVMPLPVEAELLPGNFELRANTGLLVVNQDPLISDILDCLRSRLGPATGYDLKTVDNVSNQPSNLIVLQLNEAEDSALGDEGYRLGVGPQNVTLSANKPAGLFYGVQTLLQLLPPEINSPDSVENVDWNIPCVRIMDFPRFRWRGLLLDVSRHFRTVDEVKRYIDMAEGNGHCREWLDSRTA